MDESLITTESISATVSSEMRRDAIVAVIVATHFYACYISGSVSRISVLQAVQFLHWYMMCWLYLPFYAIVRISVGNTFIACMLTIVGYSINATIVIFDRIRENMQRKKNPDHLDEVVNEQYHTDSHKKYLYFLYHIYHGCSSVYPGCIFHPRVCSSV